MIPKFTIKDSRLFFYRGFVLRVIDGDTIIAAIDRGMHDLTVEKFRLAGIDAPEMRPRVGTQEGRAAEKVLALMATDRLKSLIENKEILINTHKAGKFGRWLADLYLPEDTKSINNLLLEEQLVVKYGDPRPWRDEKR